MNIKKDYSRLSSIPKSERPRELLFEHGPEYLDDQQLIAIMLGSGTRGNDVMKLSEAVLELYQQNPIEMIAPENFCDIEGMGTARPRSCRQPSSSPAQNEPGRQAHKRPCRRRPAAVQLCRVPEGALPLHFIKRGA